MKNLNYPLQAQLVHGLQIWQVVALYLTNRMMHCLWRRRREDHTLVKQGQVMELTECHFHRDGDFRCCFACHLEACRELLLVSATGDTKTN